MNRTTIAGIFAVCVGVAACGGNRDREEHAAAPAGDTAEAKPITITETGCLTARGEQFVLTDLQPATGAAGTSATQTYQLVGEDEELRQHVGKQVRVSGEAEGAQVTEVRELTPDTASKPEGTSGAANPNPTAVPRSPGQGDAQVRTETETRMEVRKLRVASVTPTGDSCADETLAGENAPPKGNQGGARRPGQ